MLGAVFRDVSNNKLPAYIRYIALVDYAYIDAVELSRIERIPDRSILSMKGGVSGMQGIIRSVSSASKTAVQVCLAGVRLP